MSDRASQRQRLITFLLMAAGAIFLLVGALAWLPAQVQHPVAEAAPADFGEAAPPLRPTVTPLPFPSQVTPPPIELPDSSQPYPPATTATPAATSLPTARVSAGPTRLVISAINLDAPVEMVGWHTVNGASQWDVPDHFAAGWLKLSALLGAKGNTVLTGHHNIAGEVFRNLVKLKPGDRLTLYAQDTPFYYTITTRKILAERGQSEAQRLENAKWMQPTDDERITLITCWPYTSNTHRLIIVAQPAAPEKSNPSIAP